MPAVAERGALPTSDTVVLYPAGEVHNAATVLHVQSFTDGLIAVILDETAFHPVDAGWPDQGADRGFLRAADGSEVQIVDAVVAATDGSELFIGEGIPAKKGDEGWTFVVAHLVSEQASLTPGDSVEVVVDEGYRKALSVGHTACHLASLALNRAMAGRWTKEVRQDALGQPDFDGSAIESSRIHEDGSVDVFRLNKSLRRKGFGTDGLAEALVDIEAAVNDTLAAWVSTAATVRIDRAGTGLTDRRSWVCELPEATVSIPCGGTHVSSLGAIGGLQVTLELHETDGTPTLTMYTDENLL